MKRDDRAIADFDCEPVDCWINDAILVERLLAVVDAAAEGELRIKVDNPPVIFKKSASGIRGNVKVLICHADLGSCLEERGATVDLVPVGDAACDHINEHVVFSLIELAFDVGCDFECGDSQQKVDVYLL